MQTRLPQTQMLVLLQVPTLFAASLVFPNGVKVPGPKRWPLVGTLPSFLGRGGADALTDVHAGCARRTPTLAHPRPSPVRILIPTH